MTTIDVAVDSGGTRTTIAMAVDGDPSGPRRFVSRATLSGYLRPDRVPATLREVVREAEADYLARGLAGTAVSVFVGAAGFADATRDQYRRALDELLADGFGGDVTVVGAANDAMTLLLGHDAGGVVIAGTGSNVVLRTPDDRIVQAGGHDWVASDQGSGFWIGLEGVRRVAQDLEDGVSSALVEAFGAHFGAPADVDKVVQFRVLSVADDGMKARIAGFAAPVCRAAEAGDPAAERIVVGQADALAGLVARAVRRHLVREAAAPIRLVECGGVLANEYYRALFEDGVMSYLRDGGVPQAIVWHRVDSCLDAALNNARRLPTLAAAWRTLPLPFRPVIRGR